MLNETTEQKDVKLHHSGFFSHFHGGEEGNKRRPDSYPRGQGGGGGKNPVIHVGQCLI